MNKKKLAGIIIGCTTAIVVVSFIAGCNPPAGSTLSLTYQADMTGVESGTEDEIMDGVKTVIERRIDALGTTQSTVQVQKQEDEYNIVIQISGLFDLERIKEMVPLFSIIEFREEDTTANWIPATGTVNGQDLTLSSRYFKENTSVTVDQYGKPLLVFEMNETGAQLFEQISTRLIDKPLAIFLGDDRLLGEDGHIIAPVVRAVISDKGQIEGLSLVDAQELSRVLNAGRIRVPLGYWAEEGESKVFVPNIPLYEQVTG